MRRAPILTRKGKLLGFLEYPESDPLPMTLGRSEGRREAVRPGHVINIDFGRWMAEYEVISTQRDQTGEYLIMVKQIATTCENVAFMINSPAYERNLRRS